MLTRPSIKRFFVNFQLITDPQQFQEACAQAEQASIVALDTEFVRTRTFHPQLGLIQLYDGEQLFLIDPLAVGDLKPLAQLLQNPQVLKVLHACGEDLEVFQHYLGCLPEPLLDTQIMAAFLGYGLSTGFATLVQDTQAVSLDKSESRTNWLARPLSAQQLDYAAADVFYLLPLYHQLMVKLEATPWREAAFQESAHQALHRIAQPNPETLYLTIKGAWQLTPKQLAVLKPLATWRYKEAVKRDLAINFVLKEQELLCLAKSAPTTFLAIEQAEIDPRSIHRYGKHWLTLITQAQQLPCEAYPEPIVPIIDYPHYKSSMKKLKEQVKQVAEQTGLASEFLASNKQLHQLLAWVWKKGKCPQKQPDVLQGWRKACLGDKLAALL